MAFTNKLFENEIIIKKLGTRELQIRSKVVMKLRADEIKECILHFL